VNWLKRRLVNREVKGMMKGMSNDHKSTVLGAVLAGLQLVNVDYVKLMQGDSAEIGKAVGAVVTALLGWYINKPTPPVEPPKE